MTEHYKQQLHQMRVEYAKAQAHLAAVTEELELELERMRKSDKVPHELVLKKDAQVENLVKFNNTVDDLLSLYKMSVVCLCAELEATQKLLFDAVKNNQDAVDSLLNKLLQK